MDSVTIGNSTDETISVNVFLAKFRYVDVMLMLIKSSASGGEKKIMTEQWKIYPGKG